MNRTNPAIDLAVEEIKKITTEDGWASVSDYIKVKETHKLSNEILMTALQEAGFGFVSTKSVTNNEKVIDVIVDLRIMAAAMLLVYSDDEWTLHHSVLRYLNALHTVGSWRAAFPVAHHSGLLDDVYGTYGYYFTDMAMADAAVLAVDDAPDIYRMAERHVHAISELSKSDKELTEVFHLCVRVFNVLNNAPDDKPIPQLLQSDIYHRSFENGKAYEHFWRIAVNKVLVSNRHKRLENINSAILRQRTKEL